MVVVERFTYILRINIKLNNENNLKKINNFLMSKSCKIIITEL